MKTADELLRDVLDRAHAAKGSAVTSDRVESVLLLPEVHAMSDVDLRALLTRVEEQIEADGEPGSEDIPVAAYIRGVLDTRRICRDNP